MACTLVPSINGGVHDTMTWDHFLPVQAEKMLHDHTFASPAFAVEKEINKVDKGGTYINYYARGHESGFC